MIRPRIDDTAVSVDAETRRLQFRLLVRPVRHAEHPDRKIVEERTGCIKAFFWDVSSMFSAAQGSVEGAAEVLCSVRLTLRVGVSQIEFE